MDQPEQNPYASPAAPSPRFTFSLASLMLWMTLVGVSLGLIVTLPGLGIPFAVLCVPAAVRASVAASRRRIAGKPMEVPEKAGIFASSLLVVTIIVVASAAAFTTVCFPIGMAAFGSNTGVSSGMFILACCLGLLAGGVVLFFLARWLWPIRENKTGGP